MQRVTENAKVQQVHPFAVKKAKEGFLFLQSSKNIADGVEIGSKDRNSFALTNKLKKTVTYILKCSLQTKIKQL